MVAVLQSLRPVLVGDMAGDTGEHPGAAEGSGGWAGDEPGCAGEARQGAQHGACLRWGQWTGN